MSERRHNSLTGYPRGAILLGVCEVCCCYIYRWSDLIWGQGVCRDMFGQVDYPPDTYGYDCDEGLHILEQ